MAINIIAIVIKRCLNMIDILVDKVGTIKKQQITERRDTPQITIANHKSELFEWLLSNLLKRAQEARPQKLFHHEPECHPPSMPLGVLPNGINIGSPHEMPIYYFYS